jgi:gas vesicle protein
MARDDSGAGSIILAFVLGAITGAAAALLTAPASGEETRRKITEKARDGADQARRMADQGRDVWSRQRETLSNAIDRGREAYNQARGAQPSGAPGGEEM